MFYTILALIFLVMLVAGRMLALRLAAIKSGKVSIGYFRLNSGAEVPKELTQASRNYTNLFEMPVLFYVGATLAIALHIETPALVTVAWLFVASRYLHSWIHLNTNNVIRRFQAFLASNVFLLIMWGILVVNYFHL